MTRRGSEGFWSTALGQALLAGGTVAAVLLTVLAGIALTYREQLAWGAPTPTPALEGTAAPSPTLVRTPAPPSPTRTPIPISSPSPQPTPTETPQATATPALATAEATSVPPPFPTCLPPGGWQPYVVHEGDSLHVLAWQRGTTTYAVLQANCLDEATLVAGQVLYLPPLPGMTVATATPRPVPAVPCGRPPASWRVYVVRKGDTLSDLAIRYGTTVPAIMSANCLASTTIYTGQRLYLPAQAIWWPPAPTPTPRPWPTLPPPTPAFPPTAPAPPPTVPATPTPWVTPLPPPEPTPAPPTPAPTAPPPAPTEPPTPLPPTPPPAPTEPPTPLPPPPTPAPTEPPPSPPAP